MHVSGTVVKEPVMAIYRCPSNLITKSELLTLMMQYRIRKLTKHVSLILCIQVVLQLTAVEYL